MVVEYLLANGETYFVGNSFPYFGFVQEVERSEAKKMKLLDLMNGVIHKQEYDAVLDDLAKLKSDSHINMGILNNIEKIVKYAQKKGAEFILVI